MASIPNSPWTVHGAPIIDRLTAMFNAGVSTSRIAATLSQEFRCYLTRNAVIGKASRIGLKSPNDSGFEGYNKKRKNGGAVWRHEFRPRPKAQAALAETLETATEAIPLHISLLDLTPTSCRFPYGQGPYTFCGCEALPGLPYCAPHTRACVEPRHGNTGKTAPKEFVAAMRRNHLPKTIILSPAEDEAA